MPAKPKLKSPQGWFPTGSHPENYTMGLTDEEFHSGNQCGAIYSIDSKCKGFGTLMQGFEATEYLNQRIQLTGWIKTLDVKSWCGMWMRIDGPAGQKELYNFDNMEDRSIKGTTDWQSYQIVLNVPSDSVSVNFGVLLNGTGKVWFDDFEFLVVGEDVPTTNMYESKVVKRSYVKKKKMNLDFSM